MTLTNLQLIEQFITHILSIKRYSPLTARNYRHDLEEFLRWGELSSGGDFELLQVKGEDLRRWIGCKHNDYELLRFREWNDFVYEFDDSRMIDSNDRPPNELIVTIFEKSSGRQIRRFCWGNGDEKV